MPRGTSGALWWTAGLASLCGFAGGVVGFLTLARIYPAVFLPAVGQDMEESAPPGEGEDSRVPPSLRPASSRKREAESQNEIVQAAKRVNPAVVRIDVYRPPDPRLANLPGFQAPMPTEGSGSGFLFDKSGLLMTNQHVIDGADSVTVVLEDGRKFPDVEVKGEDFMSDIAVLQIPGQNLPQAPLGTAQGLNPGEWVIAIGNPFRDFEHSVTLGIVSAVGRFMRIPDPQRGRERYYTNLIQTDAAINVGNSGGPLINIAGEVVGINSAIFSPTQTSLGIGFAIPIDDAKVIARHLIETGQVPYLGIHLEDLSREEKQEIGVSRGVKIAAIEPDSPAAMAGLRPGDILLEIGGKPLSRSDEIPQLLFQHRVGQVVPFRLRREGREHDLPVRIGARE